MKRVAIYVRVSTEEQAQEGFSIAAQTTDLTEYAKQTGATVVGVFADEGYTGKNMNRPYLQKLLQTLDSDGIDEVWVWRADRMARYLHDFLTIIDHIHRNRAILRSYMEHCDTSTPGGILNLQLMGSVAQYTGTVIVENARLGQNKRAKAGLWNGNPPLGYRMENKLLVIEPEEAKTVKLIFSEYLSGKGVKAIVNILNKNGYTTKNRKHFCILAVHKILRNPVYVGKVVYGRLVNWSNKRREGKNDNPIVVDGQHESIIDKETWEAVQSIIQAKSYTKPRNVLHYPLSGLVRCPQCGAPTVGFRQKRNRGGREIIYRYYMCGAYHNGGSAVCRGNLINAEETEKEVFKRLSEALANEKMISRIVGQVNERRNKNQQILLANQKKLEQELSSVKTKLNRWFSAFEEGTIEPEDVSERMSELKENRILLEQQLIDSNNKLISEETQIIPPQVISELLKQFDRLITNSESEEIKEILRLIIKEIIVNKVTRKVEKVELNFDLSLHNNNEIKFKINPKYRMFLNNKRLGSCLSLFMIRFTPVYPKCPVNLLC